MYEKGDMMRYYISDMHFYHYQLNIQMDCRGFSDVEQMNDHMISKWNSRVKPKDEVVILGDLSLGTAEETNQILKRLNGALYLIEGNHDRYLKKSEFHRERFVWIKPYAEMRDNGRKVVLSHYPVFCYNGQYHRNKSGEPTTYMLYDHVHDTMDEQLVRKFCDITKQTMRKSKYDEEPQSIPCNMINCFCMYSDYIPLSLDEWIENAKQRSLKSTEK